MSNARDLQTLPGLSEIIPRVSSRPRAFMSVKNSSQPSSASSIALALPMPLPAPVKNALVPFVIFILE